MRFSPEFGLAKLRQLAKMGGRGFIVLAVAVGLATSLPTARAVDLVWKDVPIGGGGYMTGMHFHPTQGGLAYLRSDVSGPWKRTSASGAWTAVRENSFNPTLVRGGRNGSGAGALALDPVDPNILYAEFSDTAASLSGGLYKSTDGGLTWNITRTAYGDSNYNNGSGARKWGEAIVIDPQNRNVVYYGTLKNGIYRTLTAGSSWSSVRASDGDYTENGSTRLSLTRSVAIDAKSALVSGRSSVIYASASNVGIVRSTNGGDTWSAVGSSFNQNFLALRPAGTSGEPIWVSSMAVGEDQALYVGFRYGLAKYDPATDTWSKITVPGAKANSSVDYLALAKSTTPGVLTPRIAICGHRNVSSSDWAVFRSTNGGTSWLPMLYAASGGNTTVTQASWHWGNLLYQSPASISLNPLVEGEAYVMDAYSVWKCTSFWAPSGTTAWVSDHVGVENIVPITMLSAPASTSGKAAPLYTGVSDVMGFRHPSLTTAPTTAARVNAASGDWCPYVTGYAVQEANPDVVWAVKHRTETNGNAAGVVLRSTNGGETWPLTAANPYATNESYGGAKIAVSATNGNNAVVIPGNYNDSNGNPVNLPSKYTTDGGASWQICKVASDGSDLPPFFSGSSGKTAYRAARIVTADRVNGGTFYALSPTGGKVWRSFDSGATWSLSAGAVSGWGFTDSLSPPHLVAAPGRAGEVWAGMSGNGIFRSVDSGDTWQRITFFKAPGNIDNRASLVTFGKEAPGTGADNPTIYVYAFPAAGNRPALYRCTNLKAAAGNNAALEWSLVQDWTYTGYKGFLLEGDRQTFGRVFMAAGTSFAYAQTEPEPVPTDPVAHWKFEETSGTAAADASGHGHIATFTPAPVWTSTPTNRVVEFSGSTYAQVADSPLLDGTNQLSLSFWVRPTNLNNATARFIASKRTSFAADDAAYTVFFHTGNKLFVDLASTNNRFSTNTVFANNQWYHVAVIFDGTLPEAGRVKVYVNGVLDITASETSAALPDVQRDLQLGRSDANSPASFGGRLDDFRIYRLPLTAPAVAALAAEPGYWNPPDTPVLAPPVATSAVALSWSDPGPEEDSFEIQRSLGGVLWDPIQTTAADAVIYLDEVVAAGQTYSYRVRGSNPAGSGDWSQIQNATTWTAKEAWRDSTGLAIDGSGTSADDADPDHDGLVNLLEYAFDQDPRNATTAPATTGSLDSNGHLVLTFFRARPATELTYSVQAAGDLSDWSEVIAVNPGAVGENVTVPDNPPVGAARRFLRLKITSP